MIDVLVVEDSASARELLVHILNTDPEIRVIGTASNGLEALEFMEHKIPNIITMDIQMPNMDGVLATRRIMESHPVPIVIVSGSWKKKEVLDTFSAMEAGALAVMPRPYGIGHSEYEQTAQELIKNVKLMSEVKVVKRRSKVYQEKNILGTEEKPDKNLGKFKIVVIGASTGGPQVLQTIIGKLSPFFPIPILIVQHIASGFLDGLVDWLGKSTPLHVRVAQHEERILPKNVYIAPDGWQMVVAQGGLIHLTHDEPKNGHRPSVSYLFRSAAEVFGPNAIGVLLTGMGKDGAEELKYMKELGAVTIAQDLASSVVHGMPGEAIRLDAATYIQPADLIPETLKMLARNGRLEL